MRNKISESTRRRRLIRRISSVSAVFAAAALFMYCGAFGASAEEWDSSGRELYKILPEDVRDKLPPEIEESLEDPSADSSHTAELLSAPYFFTQIKNTISSLVENFVLSFCRILAVICLCSLLRAVKDSFFETRTGNILSYIGMLSLSYAVYMCIIGIWDRIYGVLETMRAFVTALVPLMISLYTAGGNITAAAVSNGGLMYVLAAMEQLCSGGLYPVLQICFGLTLLGGCQGKNDLKSILGFIKNTFIALLTFIVGLLCGVMALQSHLAQSADNMLSRTVKFAVGSFIPVIGGAVSDATQAVLGGMSFLKNTVGTVSAAAVILIVVPVVSEIFMYRTGFKFMAMISKIVGCDAESSVLDGCADILDLGNALLICCGVMILFCLLLFIKCSLSMS